MLYRINCVYLQKIYAMSFCFFEIKKIEWHVASIGKAMFFMVLPTAMNSAFCRLLINLLLIFLFIFKDLIMSKILNYQVDAVASSEKMGISKMNLLRIGSQSFVYVLAVSIAIAMTWLLPAVYEGANGEQIAELQINGQKANSIMVASANANGQMGHFSFSTTASLHESGLIAGR